jgi:hypothetical protein
LSPPASPERPIANRPFSFGRALGFAVLVAAVPAIVAFCWHSVIATIGDDSVSYLTLARHFSPWNPDPLAARWAPYFSNFPPLFPLLLALTGGAYDLLVAHMVVAAGGIASLFLVHSYARARLGSECGSLAGRGPLPAAAGHVAGTHRHPQRVDLSRAFARRLASRGDARASGEPRAQPTPCSDAGWRPRCFRERRGFALLLGYAANVGFVAWRRRGLPEPRVWLPVAIGVAAQLAWLALRPKLAVPAYQQWLGVLGEAWLQHPAATLAESWQYLSRGWIGDFASDAAGGATAAFFFGLVALAALAGAVRAARDERLDGWYVLVSVAMLLLWRFNEDNSRRLLFPLLPLALLHAAETVRAIALRFPQPARRWVAPAAFALLAAMVLPASQLILRKSLDREPYYPGLGYSPSSMKDYYGIVNDRQAREEAHRGASVLAGLSYLEAWTPPGARVMWVRPEYIAVLGRREGVPLYLRWDRATLAREILRTRTDFVVASRQFKNDLAADTADAFLWIARDLPAYLVAVAILPDAARGDFTVLRVDAAALERYIRDTEGAPPGPPGPAR